METIEKTWGHEKWFANSELYCGKLIFIAYGKWSSDGAYHYHKIKDETFLVIKGQLQLEYYEDNIHRLLTLNPNDSFHIAPGVKHRFTTCLSNGCVFVETSTEHFEEDSYRCVLEDDKWVAKK